MTQNRGCFEKWVILQAQSRDIFRFETFIQKIWMMKCNLLEYKDKSRDILSFEKGFIKSGGAQVSLNRVEISQDSDWP